MTNIDLEPDNNDANTDVLHYHLVPDKDLIKISDGDQDMQTREMSL